MDSTTKTIMYIGGGFLLYKLFIAPKTTAIPTQAAPVYTTGTPVQSSGNTGTLITAGVSTVATLLKNLLGQGSTPAAASQPASGTTASTQQQATNDNIDTSVSNIFSSLTPVVSSGSGTFGLPTSFTASDLDEE